MPIAPAAVFLQTSLAVRAIAARAMARENACSVGELAGVNASRLATQPTMHAALLSMLVYVGDPNCIIYMHLHAWRCLTRSKFNLILLPRMLMEGAISMKMTTCALSACCAVLRCQTNLNIALSCASVCRTCVCYLQMKTARLLLTWAPLPKCIHSAGNVFTSLRTQFSLKTTQVHPVWKTSDPASNEPSWCSFRQSPSKNTDQKLYT